MRFTWLVAAVYFPLFFLSALETAAQSRADLAVVPQTGGTSISANKKALSLSSRAAEKQAKLDRKLFKTQLQLLNRTLRIKPDAGTYAQRGRLKIRLNDAPGAIKDFSRALKLSPDSVQFFHLRGISKLQNQDYLGALEDLNTFLKGRPNSAIGFRDRAKAKGGLLDYRGSIEDNDQALRLNDRDDEAYYNRAVAKYYIKDFAGAIADFTKVIELQQHLEETYFNRGIARYSLGDKDGACIDLSKAGELGYEEAYSLIKQYCR